MIPLTVPHFGGNELKYVTDCIETGWVSSAGTYVTQFEEMVAEFSGQQFGVATVNGTSGLHLSLHMLGVGPGDGVLIPNITFIASANAVVYTGADPIFIDIDPATWQMDLDLLQDFLENQTHQRDSKCILNQTGKHLKVIMPVHVLGNMCDMKKLLTLAEHHNIDVVEDATEALGSYCNGKHAGSWGVMSVFSFNGNKIISTGGGGVIVTNDQNHALRAKHLSTQSKVDPEKYYHDEIGFNYRLVNVLAAIGVAQMEQLPDFIQKKKSIDQFYRSHLHNIGDIKFQRVERNVDPNCWLFTFYTHKKEIILHDLKHNEVIARPFWTPMNQLPMFRDSTYITRNDTSRDVHAHCLSIPSSVSMTDDDMQKVVEIIADAY